MEYFIGYWPIIYIIVGIVAGFLAGLLGIGGGFLIVPVLLFVFDEQGFAAERVMHMALATSLATIVVTSLSSIRAHHYRGGVDWSTVFKLLPGIVLGGALGAWSATGLSRTVLQPGFGVLELVLAVTIIYRLWRSPVELKASQAVERLPGTAGMSSAGIGIGFLSALAGIGGGSLTVPFLLWRGFVMRVAVGTSAACGFPVALTGMVGYAWLGASVPGLPQWSIGYLYLPAWLAISITTVLCAPIGARLAHDLPDRLVKFLFALLLSALGLMLLIN